MKKIFILFVIIGLSTISVNSQNIANISDTKEASVNINYTKKDPKIISLPDINREKAATIKQKISKDNAKVNSYQYELYKPYFIIYKISDKIIRANNLTNTNWRFRIDQKAEDINAYATAVNFVSIYSSLYDSLYNDPDALAFIISHEMSHLIYNHNQKNLDLYTKREGMKEWSELYIPCTLGLGYFYYIPKYYWTYKTQRGMELEADSEAIFLMARAGYDVNGAYTAMDFIGKVANKYSLASTHPKPGKRVENIAKTISSLNIDNLKQEGFNNLLNSTVLIPVVSSDNKSLVINKPENSGNKEYIKSSGNSNYLYSAYRNYLNDNYDKAADLFTKAYNTDKKNYIAPLYLSYTYEIQYYQTKDPIKLKNSLTYAKKAKKLAPTNINVLKQYNEIKGKYSSEK